MRIQLTRRLIEGLIFYDLLDNIIPPNPNYIDLYDGYRLNFLPEYHRTKTGNRKNLNDNTLIGWRIILTDREGRFKSDIMDRLFPELKDPWGTITCTTEDELDHIINTVEKFSLGHI